MSLTDRALWGALAGFVATAPMSLAMVGMKRLLPWWERYPLPPKEVTMEVAERAGIKEELNEPAREIVTAASHFGYGAAAGALYGTIARELPGHWALRGIVFGLAVWAGSYLGWLPLAGIYEPATEHPARRNALMIAAHVVWGASLGALFSRTSKKNCPEERETPRFPEARRMLDSDNERLGTKMEARKREIKASR